MIQDDTRWYKVLLLLGAWNHQVTRSLESRVLALYMKQHGQSLGISPCANPGYCRNFIPVRDWLWWDSMWAGADCFFLASFRCDSQRVDCDVSPWSQWDSLRIDFSAWQHECTMTHEHCKDLEGRKLMEIRYIGSRNRSLRGSLLCLWWPWVLLKSRTLVTRLVMVDKVIVIARFSFCWSASHDAIRFRMDVIMKWPWNDHKVTMKWPWSDKIRNMLSTILINSLHGGKKVESTRFIHRFSFVLAQPFVVSSFAKPCKVSALPWHTLLGWDFMFLLLAHTCFIFETMRDMFFSHNIVESCWVPCPYASALVVHGKVHRYPSGGGTACPPLIGTIAQWSDKSQTNGTKNASLALNLGPNVLMETQGGAAAAVYMSLNLVCLFPQCECLHWFVICRLQQPVLQWTWLRALRQGVKTVFSQAMVVCILQTDQTAQFAVKPLLQCQVWSSDVHCVYLVWSWQHYVCYKTNTAPVLAQIGATGGFALPLAELGRRLAAGLTVSRPLERLGRSSQSSVWTLRTAHCHTISCDLIMAVSLQCLWADSSLMFFVRYPFASSSVFPAHINWRHLMLTLNMTWG